MMVIVVMVMMTMVIVVMMMMMVTSLVSKRFPPIEAEGAARQRISPPSLAFHLFLHMHWIG